MSMIYMLPMTISLSLMVFLFILSLLNFKNKTFFNKMNSFECGFTPISPPRGAFSMQFFKILLIFLLFDMEILIIMPLPIYHFSNFFSLNFILFILFLVIFSLYFEWSEGSLNWLK